MLSDTDIHYLVGFLWIATSKEDIDVTLGERVLDIATETTRDVDIVVLKAGDVGVVGIEVKAETPRLDSPIVEGLCAKLNDMPDLKRRLIVSASGFTRPALRKAKAHGLECLTLVRGQIPPFATVNMSQLKGYGIKRQSWVAEPDIQMFARGRADALLDAAQSIATTDRVTFDDGAPETTAQWLLDFVANTSLQQHDFPVGEEKVAIELKFVNRPRVHASKGIFEFESAIAVGRVRVIEEVKPLDEAWHLRGQDGAAFAGAAILEIDEGLIGLMVSPDKTGIRTFTLPSSLRAIRPTRVKL